MNNIGLRNQGQHDFRRQRSESPNDPKLSDGGAWRGSCEGGAKTEATDVGQMWLGVKTPKQELAATVTRGAVRCSAWLGVAVISEKASGVKVFISGTSHRGSSRKTEIQFRLVLANVAQTPPASQEHIAARISHRLLCRGFRSCKGGIVGYCARPMQRRLMPAEY